MRNDLTITLAVLAFSGNLSAQAGARTPASAAPSQAGGTVGLNGLPPAVKATVEAETRNAALKSVSREQENGRIVKIESVTTRGRTHYEGHVRTKAGKTIAIEIDADGKPITP